MKYGTFSALVGLLAASLAAAESASPPAAATSTASHAVIQAGQHWGEKARVHRFERLRSGAVKTEKGWNVQDFASAFFNPSKEEITVSMKMVSDDPKFRFANGQVGVFTKTYTLGPMRACTDNIYIGSPANGKPNWPVAYRTNFTGSVEFTGSKPFYYYMLRETDIGQDPDLTKAYYAAWNPWSDEAPTAWDDELGQFVVPYTNYWHNEAAWPIGWQSLLTLKNDTDRPATYAVKHVPSYGAQFNPKNSQITYYKEQTVRVRLQGGEKRTIPLQVLFGWAADQMSSMEGYLLIKPDRADAKGKTSVRLSLIPNDSGKPLHGMVTMHVPGAYFGKTDLDADLAVLLH